MKAKEFVARHKKLESNISLAINNLIRDYENEVGLGVASIHIDSLEATAMGDDFKRLVFSAEVKLDLSE